MADIAARKVILSLGVSIDGYIARADGSFDFLFIPKDFDMSEFMASCDVTIMGRKSLEVAQAFGSSYASGDPASTFVYSRTRPEGPAGGLTYTRQDPGELVASIRKRPGKNIWLYGGGEVVREFLRADMVDELMIGIVPVLLGDGIPLFPRGFPERQFELRSAKSYDQGLVVLTYARKR